CPCPAQCFGHRLGWAIFCEWAAQDPADPNRLRHICNRSAMPERLEPPAAAPPQYPPLAQQAVNLARSLWDWATSGLKMATDAEVSRRLAICEGCPQYDREPARCRLCGCYTQAKIRLRTERCPEEKW